MQVAGIGGGRGRPRAPAVGGGGPRTPPPAGGGGSARPPPPPPPASPAGGGGPPAPPPGGGGGDGARRRPPLPPVTRATRPSRGCSAPTQRSHDLHLARCCCAEVMDRAHHCRPLGGPARRPGGLVRVDDGR